MLEQEASNAFLNELDEEIDRVDVEEEIETYHQLSAVEEKEQRREVRRLVEPMLKEKLGDAAALVVQYLGWGLKRNTMSISNTARASMRYFKSHSILKFALSNQSIKGAVSPRQLLLLLLAAL